MGSRKADNKKCISFDEITAVWVGKRTPAFKKKTAQAADEDCCLSIAGKRTLDLEATTQAIRDVWADALCEVVGCSKMGARKNSKDEKSASNKPQITINQPPVPKNVMTDPPTPMRKPPPPEVPQPRYNLDELQAVTPVKNQPQQIDLPPGYESLDDEDGVIHELFVSIFFASFFSYLIFLPFL